MLCGHFMLEVMLQLAQESKYFVFFCFYIIVPLEGSIVEVNIPQVTALSIVQ